jgi:AraC-like DNA-binding protein
MGFLAFRYAQAYSRGVRGEGDYRLGTLGRPHRSTTLVVEERFDLETYPGPEASFQQIQAHSIERVAGQVGFNAVTTFRERFRDLVGTSPQRYRTQFRTSR